MDYKKAVSTSCTPQPPSPSLRLLSLADALNESARMHTLQQKQNNVCTPDAKLTNEAIAQIYQELMSYWPEFGILDNCSLETFVANVQNIFAIRADDFEPLE